MYAIIVTGGKQYKVQQGDVLFVEKLEAEEGAEVKFDTVLAEGEAAEGEEKPAKKTAAKKTAKKEEEKAE